MKNFKISATLGMISLVCALLIALVNMLSKPIIEANEKRTELATCQAIFSDYDQDKSKEETDLSGRDSRIKKIIYVYSSTSDISIGTIYKVSGKNAYGNITLMVGINKEGNVIHVEFLENGQSYASTVNNHVSANYPSSESTDVHIGAYKKAESKDIDELSGSDVAAIDVKCGATFGATLVKELVTVAVNDAKEAA